MERVQIQGQRATLLSDQLARDPRHLAKGRLRQSILLRLGEVQILPRGGAAAVDGPHQALRDDQPQRVQQARQATLAFRHRKRLHQARQGLRHTVGMRGGVDQMTGLRRQDHGVDGIRVPRFAHQDDHRLAAQAIADPRREALEMDPDLVLGDERARAGHGIVDVLDGRLIRDDLAMGIGLLQQGADDRAEQCGLARPGRSGDDDQALLEGQMRA